MMDEEKIQQAANNYVGHEPETDESCYVSAKRVAFKDGAKWMQERLVKNLWHDVEEQPKEERILYIDKECNVYQCAYCIYKNWRSFVDKNQVIAWCYRKDILPKVGEK